MTARVEFKWKHRQSTLGMHQCTGHCVRLSLESVFLSSSYISRTLHDAIYAYIDSSNHPNVGICGSPMECLGLISTDLQKEAILIDSRLPSRPKTRDSMSPCRRVREEQRRCQMHGRLVAHPAAARITTPRVAIPGHEVPGAVPAWWWSNGPCAESKMAKCGVLVSWVSTCPRKTPPKSVWFHI